VAPGASSNGNSDKNSKSKRIRNSKGNVTVTATTEDGTLVAERILKCNK
jgi:hypothetical protein